MSSSIWTRCEGDSEIRELRLDAWRAVEAQHQVATRKLVDTDAEQQLLEQLIDTSKPPQPPARRLHYLLATPFRYPPLQHGTRFGRRAEASLFYGSETLPAAFAEVAYYRLLFLEGSSAELGVVETELTAFSVAVRTSRGIDLTVAPFAAHKSWIAAPGSYAASQPLGAAMRAAHVEAFRYDSARADRGVNVGVFSPAAFARTRPGQLQTWHCVATRLRVELRNRDYFARTIHAFERALFLVEGHLPAPAFGS